VSKHPVTWLDPTDCDPPHGLDLREPHHYEKVNMLIARFDEAGFDRTHGALVGYPLNGRVQLLSGTHRHEAAVRAGIKLPVTLWLRSDVELAWGDLEEWKRLIQDVPVQVLEESDAGQL
jgi:hypothetical protein